MNTHAPTTYRFSAGLLALLVHIAFLALLVFGISWQAKEPPGVVVDLWSNLPTEAAKPVVAPPPPPLPEPAPIKKMEPKPAPPVPMRNTDIGLKEKRKQQAPKLKEENPKQQEAAQKQAQKKQMLQEKLKDEKAIQAKAHADQQAQEALARIDREKQTAAQQSIVDDYTNRIQSRIRQKVNQTLCGNGNPQLEFDIALLPTGELRGNPVLRKGSGIAACDLAVTNAILQSDPLPVPPQPEVFMHFRDLHLVFRPNE